MSNAVAFLVIAVPMAAIGGAVIWWLEVIPAAAAGTRRNSSSLKAVGP